MAIADYDKWIHGQRKHCTSLFRSAEREIAQIDSNRRCRSKGVTTRGLLADLECMGADASRRAELIEILRQSDCPRVFTFLDKVSDKAVPELGVIDEPSPLPLFALESNQLRPLAVPVAFVCLTLLLFACTDVLRRAALERHSGWRRLTVVLCMLSAVVTFGAGLFSDGDAVDAFLLALGSLVVTFPAMIYGRACVVWVCSGFTAHVPVSAAEGEARSLPASGEPSRAGPAPVAQPLIAMEDPIATPSVRSDQSPWSPAPFWPRFWARCFDLPVCWVVGSLAIALLPDMQSLVGGGGGVILDVIVGILAMCMTIFAYEALFLSRFGATLGKMLFGISVVSVDHRLPNWQESKRRAWFYLQSGLYFGIFSPLLQILGAIGAWRRRDTGQPWEVASRTYVRTKAIGLVRFALAAVLSFGMVASMIGINMVLKEMSKQEIKRSVLG